MKFYISTTGMKRVTILSDAGVKNVSTSRRVSRRAVVAATLIVGTILPFLFVRFAFLVLESTSMGSSSLDCIRWRFLGGSDALLMRDELAKALLDVNKRDNDNGTIPLSFKELVKDVTSNRQDLKAFALKTKAMLLKMEHKVQSAKQRESIYWHFASHGVPKSHHCLSLKLAEEYAINSIARSCLPQPEHVSYLSDPSFHHLVILTDNVLAASVVVSSTVNSSKNPKKLVFHIITDKKTYTSMHAWFATNSLTLAVIEVKGLHQYDWSREVNVGIREMLEIQRLIWSHYYNNLNLENIGLVGEYERSLDALSPRCLSLMNNLRLYIPELFPDLDKVVFLDDDIVVQRDLSSLWKLDLNGKVNGAVIGSLCGIDCCPRQKYKDYLNFSNPIISTNFNGDSCGWLYGVNVFDLQAWRRTNITKTYHQWLKHNLNSGMELWYPGVLPPALIAFKNHVHPMDIRWHMCGLGYSPFLSELETLENAAVLHFNGPAKPWLEIGFPEALMSCSTVNEHECNGLKVLNNKCHCGRHATVKISESEKNKNKLYYCCEAKKCSYFLGWCLPLLVL